MCLVFIFLTFITLSFFPSFQNAYAEDDNQEVVVLTGNLICLYPVKDTGKVKPIVFHKPCHNEPDHIHFFIDTRRGFGRVYAVEGSEEAINRLEKIQERRNIQLEGKVSGNQMAWILTVE